LRKSVYAEELACRYRLPLVRFLEGGGGSVPRGGGKAADGGGEGVSAPPRFMSIMQAMALVPVVSAAVGPVAGLPAARLVASHFSIMTRDTAQVMIGGPALVERAFGRSLSKEELGGAQVHLRSGVVDNVADDEPAILPFPGMQPAEHTSRTLRPHARLSTALQTLRDDEIADLAERLGLPQGRTAEQRVRIRRELLDRNTLESLIPRLSAGSRRWIVTAARAVTPFAVVSTSTSALKWSARTSATSSTTS
jgi:hypothetical protein